MKQLLCLLSLGLMLSNGYAQNKGAEAKAAYLLAEEQFNAAKFETCVSYLDDAIKSLGAANSKILYLKIMAQRELAKKDTSYVSKLMTTIDAFEKAPDVAGFNEEKYLEVAKLKLYIQKEVLVERTPEKLAEARFMNYSIDGIRPGMSMDEVKIAHPAFFAGAKKSVITNYDWYRHNSIPISLEVKNDTVFNIVKNLFIYYDEDTSFAKASTFINNLKNEMRFNFDPVVTTKELSGKTVKLSSIVIKTYQWRLNKRTVSLQITKTTSKKTNTSVGNIIIEDEAARFSE